MMSFENTDFPFPDDEQNDVPAAADDPTEPQAESDDNVDAAPPQIVAETPIGGMPRPVIHPPAPDTPPSGSAAPPEDPGVTAPEDRETDAAPEPGQEAKSSAEPDERPSPTDVAPATDLPAVEAVEAAAKAQVVDEAETVEPAEEAPAATHEPPTLLSRPTEPKPLFAATEKVETVSKPEEWDDDLSPELAAVLFGGSGASSGEEGDDTPNETSGDLLDDAIRREPPTPARATAPVPTPAAAVRPAAPSAATPAARPGAPSAATPAPAEPVRLTDPATALSLPIAAGGMRAAAPDTRPEGKARYVRVEEPMRSDKGQRRSETWEYRGPELPQVKGRELRTVKIEEMSFADGSWRWRFERKYGDRGYDRRTVRANADRSYIERVDEINAPDELAGKRVKHRDEDFLILAAPVKTAHQGRGLLSRLLGRGSDHDEPRGEKSWRSATPDEVKHARRNGGDAF